MLLWNFILGNVSIQSILLVLQNKILSIQQDHADFLGRNVWTNMAIWELLGKLLFSLFYFETFAHCYFFLFHAA